MPEPSEKTSSADFAATDVAPQGCPACGCPSSEHFGAKNDIELRLCVGCRTIYCVQRTWADEYADHYSPTKRVRLPEFIAPNLDRLMHRFHVYRRAGRLLDVGFGDGTVLEAARRAGWCAWGVEASESAIAWARTHGFNAFHGALEAAKFADGQFDIVTVSQAIEHLPNPLSTVLEIGRILRCGGLCYAVTPHARGLACRILGNEWSVIAPPEHLQLFSISGVRALFARAGFRAVKVTSSGLNLFELMRAIRPSRPVNRVQAGYRLNQYFLRSPSRRRAKNAVNSLLNLTRLGDTLKIYAEK